MLTARRKGWDRPSMCLMFGIREESYMIFLMLLTTGVGMLTPRIRFLLRGGESRGSTAKRELSLVVAVPCRGKDVVFRVVPEKSGAGLVLFLEGISSRRGSFSLAAVVLFSVN